MSVGVGLWHPAFHAVCSKQGEQKGGRSPMLFAAATKRFASVSLVPEQNGHEAPCYSPPRWLPIVVFPSCFSVDCALQSQGVLWEEGRNVSFFVSKNRSQQREHGDV